MQQFFIYTFRVVVVYFFTYLCARILTKKAIAQMTAYEIAGIMILANVAAEPLVDKIIIKSVYGSGLLILLMLLTSRLAIINKLTPIFEHLPTIVIENGQLDMKALKYMGLSINQLKGLLRQQGYDNISEIHTAIIEPQGNVSVFPKAENSPVKLKDLNIKSKEEGITIPLIMDGSILHTNIMHIKRNEEWLMHQLKQEGVKDYKEIALAELTPSWKLNIIRK
ncbi:MAG: YetF domain-containing protein [Clostridiaceae bacterium]